MTKEQRRRRDIFLRAAGRVARGKVHHSCIAVAMTERYADDFSGPYGEMFAAPGQDRLWIRDAVNGGGKEWRLTALCFAAAMAETGDL